MPTSGYLSQSLRRPLPTKDDGILRTVADAASYMMALSKDRQRAHWQRAARLILERRSAHDLSRQVELALFYMIGGPLFYMPMWRVVLDCRHRASSMEGGPDERYHTPARPEIEPFAGRREF